MRTVTGRHELHRLAELGRVSASLLHEISNPLTSALLSIEQYADKNSPGIREAARSMQRIRKYVEAARQQARHESRQTNFSVRSQVNQIRRLVLPIAKNSGVRLQIEPVPPCRLYGDPVKFQQILANLIINAIEAYDQKPAFGADRPVKVSVENKGLKLTIRVEDRGSGIGAENLKKIFDPFFSTKGTRRKGLGIGLAIVKEYVSNDFRGSLCVKSSRHSGTSFEIKLPWRV